MKTFFFRINKKEYCHITDEKIFVVNGKDVMRVPLEHQLGEGWGIASIFNYFIFTFLFLYVALSISYYQVAFFAHPLNYGALILLLISFLRVKEGFLGSRTPMIPREKIHTVYFKTPKFSYPRVVIYFDGPEGKIIRKIIPVLYAKEALPVLKESGLVS